MSATTTLSQSDVQAIVEGFLSNRMTNDPVDDQDEQDETVKEYLVQLLMDPDAYHDDDPDNLVEAIQPFLLSLHHEDEQAATMLAQELVQAVFRPINHNHNNNGGASSENNNNNNNEIKSEPTSAGTATATSSSSLPLRTLAAPLSLKSSGAHNSEDDDPTTDQTSHGGEFPSPQRVHTQSSLPPVKQTTRKEQRRKQQEKHKHRGGGRGGGSEDASALQQQQQLTELEDDASAWQVCQQQGVVWGGRGKGGRGEYSGAVNSIKSNIHLTQVTVTLLNGTELLQHATMDIVKGHKYGLIGRNGVGKSTLLKRLAQKAIPGMPHDMRILLVQQQIDGSDDSSLQVLVQADTDRTSFLQEQETLERRMEAENNLSDDELASIAKRLGDIAAELDVISADTAEERAREILVGLQFTEEMIQGPTKNLSGGWRMRLALARSLFVTSDLLLFDECTNHLDLHGLDWLIQYLNRNTDRTLIVVSHDRMFLDAICTDIMVMEHQRLSYHVGNYSEYARQKEEKAARETQILDAAERQRSKAEAFIQKQQQVANKKSADPNKQRQAKMMKEKKLDRIGNYREDGKRYKLNSLKKFSEDHIRLAQKVTIEVDDPIIKMYFPNPSWPSGIAGNDAIVRLENFSFGYSADAFLLNNLTLSINRGSKIALVGVNGCGKSTLAKLIAGDPEVSSSSCATKGTLWKHPNLRIGHVTQYSVEELEAYSELTVIEYAEEKLKAGSASAEIVAKAAGNVRQYLGAFGLGGKRHALQKIGKLSGGERMRLCFATILAEAPHLLLLDESTNHVDIETLDSMSDALNNFEGSVLMVSHNQAFLSGFCKELWVLDQGQVMVNHSDTETFDEIFSEYRSSVMSSGGTSLSSARQERATLAKKATKQRVGARQNTALL